MITTDISNYYNFVRCTVSNDMEIHFYKDYPEHGVAGVYVTHNQTKNAIKRKERVIHTTSLTNLHFDLLDDGYRIYLHENGKMLECKVGMDGTEKDVRREHDIRRLVIAEVFQDYFYGNDKESNNARYS